MVEFDRENLIATWISIWKSGPESECFDKEYWAYEVMDNLVTYEPLRAWKLVLDILATDSSEPIVNAIGAGLVEDMLCKHGEILIDLIEFEAQNNSQLRKALRVVDIWKEDTSVYERFYSIEGIDFPNDNEIG